MKKRIVSFFLSMLLCFSLSVPAIAASSFTDVPASYWAYNEIVEAVNKGITNGYSDGTFKPGSSVTNAHFSAFLAWAFYSDEYDDSGASPWYQPYTDTLNAHSILAGTTVGSDFAANINKSINRYDMARMMYNVLVDKGAAMPSDSELKAAQNAIGDWLSIPAHYKNAVAACYAMGVLNGQSDGKFGGSNLMNRAQGCVVVYRLTQKIESGSTGTETPTKPTEPEKPVEPENPDTTSPTGASNGTLTNGKPITEEDVIELLAELEDKYPNGTPAGSNDYYSSIQFGGGYECAGFAYRISDELFGKAENPKRRVDDLSEIRPGDMIRTYKNGRHMHDSTALTAIDADGYIQSTVDGNSGDSGVNGVVRWNYNCWYPIKEQNGFTYEVWTRYPE